METASYTAKGRAAEKRHSHKLPGLLPVVAHERRPGFPPSHSDSQPSQTHQHWTGGNCSPEMRSPDRLGAWIPEAAKKNNVTVNL